MRCMLHVSLIRIARGGWTTWRDAASISVLVLRALDHSTKHLFDAAEALHRSEPTKLTSVGGLMAGNALRGKIEVQERCPVKGFFRCSLDGFGCKLVWVTGWWMLEIVRLCRSASFGKLRW